MNRERRAFAEAAEALAGTRFRLLGRDRGTGLDCVGLVLAALADIGRKPAMFGGYAMRQLEPARHFEVALDCGFEVVEQGFEPGDVLLTHAGPAQFHLVIAGPDREFIHADAGLRRVVRTPYPVPWPILRQWRLPAD